jgi:peptide/nickel transport system substrate-binding protein
MMTERAYWNRQAVTSRRGFLRGGAITGVGLAGAALIGCGDDDDEPGPPATATSPAATQPPGTTPTETADPGDGPRAGGTFHWFAQSGPGNFNVIEANVEGRQLSGRHVYDRLITPKLDERVYVLECAEEIEVVDDVTIRATLQEGLVYQDRAPVNGREVRTSDIAATHLYARTSTLANNGFQVGSLDTMETPDDRTIVFHLQRPNAYLFTGQGLGHADSSAIIPEEQLDNLGTNHPIGSGPYELVDFQMDTRHVYRRNPTYRLASDGFPLIDERIVTILPDTAAQESAFRAGQIHAQYVPTVDTAKRIIADIGDELEITQYTVLGAFEWTLCARRTKTDWADEEVFEDIRIREAFYRIFEQQPYTDLIDGGEAENCSGHLARGLTRYQLDYSESDPYRRVDPAEARQLLDAAGWDFNHTWTVTTLPGARNEGGIQIMQQQMDEIGVRTTALVAPNPEWLAAICEPGRYDFSIAGHPSYDTPLQPLRHNHTDPQQRNNTGNIGDPRIDAMIEESETLLDPTENEELVKQIQRELLELYSHRIYINSFFARDLRWNFVRDWEVSAANVDHINFQNQAWLDL